MTGPTSRTSYTGSEWREFEDSAGPDEAWGIACHIWDEERLKELKGYNEFLKHTDDEKKDKKEEALDLLGALYELYTGNTNVYHELMDRLRALVHELGYQHIAEASHAELLRGR